MPDKKEQTEFVRTLASYRKPKPGALEEKHKMETWAKARKLTAVAVLGSLAALAIYRHRVRTG